jgi:hypothetical protein
MYSDSRKAQYNSFAHHRASLLFSRRLIETGVTDLWSATVHEGTDPADRAKALHERVTAGMRGLKQGAAALV